MDEQPVDRETLLTSLPPSERKDVRQALRTLIRQVERKVIVEDYSIIECSDKAAKSIQGAKAHARS